jgi:hypothetical protein
MAAFPASALVCQNPIKRYEHSPTPYQPTNIKTKLSAVTRITIKNVNRDKKLKNRGKCGSVFMYAHEYKCTMYEIIKTTANIIILSLSSVNE